MHDSTPSPIPDHDDSFDYESYVAESWPGLPAAQAHSVATYLYLGWTALSIGRAGEVNVEKSSTSESGYIRTDGTYRSA